MGGGGGGPLVVVAFLAAASTRALTPQGKREIRRMIRPKPTTKTKEETTGRLVASKRRSVDFLGVVDFECTCERGWGYKHEIIEFPLVLVDCRLQEVVGEFQSYVRPTEDPRLSDFCIELTGINQTTVDAAPTLPLVLADVHTFLRPVLDGNATFALATDGWDLHHFLDAECRRKSIEKPGAYLDEWVDLTRVFDRMAWEKRPKRRTNLAKMLRYFGLAFQGRPHSGIDDARNLARVAIKLLDSGACLEVNDNIRLKTLFLPANRNGSRPHADARTPRAAVPP